MLCLLSLLQAEINSKATQSVRSDVMNLSTKDPSITFENVTEEVALSFCHTYSPERDVKVRFLWLSFSLEPTVFVFISPLILLCLSSRFTFWNTWSSRDREVLQSSPSSKLNLILFLHVCFFGSLVLVVVVISWFCRQVQSQWCNTKD